MQTRLKAPAKINLGLSIVGRRPDGYHLLQSLYWPINFFDELYLSTTGGPAATAIWANDAIVEKVVLPQGDENLVGRALTAICRKSPNTWSVEIQKRIPLGGGLGGGSADAGTLLRYWASRPIGSIHHAKTVAEELGSDISFFLNPNPSWVTGRGETNQALAIDQRVLDEIRFLIIMPPIASDTKLAYQDFLESNAPFDAVVETDPGSFGWTKMIAYLAKAHNSLEGVVSTRFPIVKDILIALRQTNCLYAGLSGSGSSCVAAYRSQTECDEAAQVLESFCRSFHCRSLKTETYANG